MNLENKTNSYYILGISAFYHDSSACLLKDGRIIAAAQEERFTRIKHDENFPIHAVKYCLESAKISVEDLNFVAFYEKPILKFERLLQTYIKNWPRGFFSFAKAMRSWLSKKLWIESEIRRELQHCRISEKTTFDPKKLENVTNISISPLNGNSQKPEVQGSRKNTADKRTLWVRVRGYFFADKEIRSFSEFPKILYVPHHISHAASSFYNSGFDKSVILTVDGVGEWATTTLGFGEKKELRLDQEISFPDSLGLFYSAFTYYLGFKVNSGEYKVMGLAPYGKPKYTDKIYELLEIFEDGSFRLRPEFFAYEYDLKMISPKFIKHFGMPVRLPKDPLTEWHKDLAASLQSVTEDILLKLVSLAHKKYNCENICLSGGVALNCVANGRIQRESKFKNLYIFPASGDAGGGVGAAQYVYHHVLKGPKNPEKLENIYLGPSDEISDIIDFLQYHCIKFVKYDKNEELWKTIARFLQENNVIGVLHKKMEFGPRALGNRSIIADPRQKENWKRVNLKIKFRESFRPFAPSVLLEKSSELYDLRGEESPYMLLTAKTKVDFLPATTHVDSSARIQTVSKLQNENFYGIISEFENLTGCPAVINTSFNVRGEPIVCDYQDAFKCFLGTDMDVLVLENIIIKAKDVNKEVLKKKFVFQKFEED